MASVSRTPGGAYKARCCVGRDPLTGKQVWRVKNFHPLDTLTPARAEKELMRRIDEWETQQRRDHEAGLDQHRDRMTLDTFTRERWWTHIESRNLAPNTVISYKKLMETTLEFFGARVRLVEITVERIDAFVRWLRSERKYSDRTTRMCFDVLRSVLDYACECGYIDTSPIDRMKNRPTVTHGEPDYLTEDEARRFLECLDSDKYLPSVWKCLFQLLLFSGIRKGEGLALQWCDYDADRKELTISKSITLTGNAGGETAVKLPKNNKTRRVPVSDSLAAILDQRRREMERNYGEDFSDKLYIFGMDRDPTRPRNPSAVYQRMQKFQRRNGLREVGVHTLRHSFASLALMNGADLKAIQATLGHSRPSMTLQFYSGISERANRAAVNALERAVKPTQATQDAPQA